jgi:uncharacterized RDD family membrane protein YckC
MQDGGVMAAAEPPVPPAAPAPSVDSARHSGGAGTLASTSEPLAPSVEYVSPAARRSLQWRAAALAVLLGGTQILAPLGLVVWILVDSFASLFAGGVPESVALDQERLLVLERPLSSTGRHRLVAHDLAQPGQTTRVAELPRGDLMIIPTRAAVWLVASDEVHRVQGNRTTVFRPPQELVWYSAPHAVEGLPAVLDWEFRDSMVLKVLEGGSWVKRGSIDLSPVPSTIADDFDVVIDRQGVYHLFCLYGQRIHYTSTRLGSKLAPPTRWRSLGELRGVRRWDGSVFAGHPALITVGQSPMGYPRVVARSHDGSEWRELLSDTSQFVHIAKGEPAADGGLTVAAAGGFGTLDTWKVSPTGEVRRVRLGKQPLWASPTGIITMSLPLYLIAALALPAAAIGWVWVRRYRHVMVRVGGSGRYASLTRRALARGVDLCILVAPFLSAIVLFVLGVVDSGVLERHPMLLSVGAMVASLLWYLPVVLMLSWLEGRWGKTPGKWLLSIRTVGTDLRPCGFWRAILRNLLLLADGFGAFVVGLTCAMLTQRLQRVGDIAASTVVLDDRTH